MVVLPRRLCTSCVRLTVRLGCSIAFKAASGLEPLFQTLGLDTDAQSLERAVTWLKKQGANNVADLNQLPPGTYSCRELAESLGLPLLKAQRLLSALEGASQHHAAKAPAPIQPVPPPQPQLAPMFAHMAIAASPPVRYLRMRVPRTAYPRLPCRRGS